MFNKSNSPVYETVYSDGIQSNGIYTLETKYTRKIPPHLSSITANDKALDLDDHCTSLSMNQIDDAATQSKAQQVYSYPSLFQAVYLYLSIYDDIIFHDNVLCVSTVGNYL